MKPSVVVLAALAAGVFAALAAPALAVAPDECEKQRALFPKDWNDVTGERPIWICRSHYAGLLEVRLGPSDPAGRRPMSLVPVRGEATGDMRRDRERPIYRIWLDPEQVRRLREGRYFATIVRAEESCWIRGDLSGDTVFFMDAARPPSDREDAGAFYNKAPRTGAFGGQAWDCEKPH
ncbi:MAG: hypothetical protein GX458_02325 [Phyllobacteriaceae bacterium]|nr:hypothetical protein [Phyllobacteriaceae bacterium]